MSRSEPSEAEHAPDPHGISGDYLRAFERIASLSAHYVPRARRDQANPAWEELEHLDAERLDLLSRLKFEGDEVPVIVATSALEREDVYMRLLGVECLPVVIGKRPEEAVKLLDRCFRDPAPVVTALAFETYKQLNESLTAEQMGHVEMSAHHHQVSRRLQEFQGRVREARRAPYLWE